jgi:hypothetical protein
MGALAINNVRVSVNMTRKLNNDCFYPGVSSGIKIGEKCEKKRERLK